MRLLFLAVIATVPSAALAVSVPDGSRKPHASQPDKCPRTTNYHAWRQGEPLKPQKLTELPDANAYAAVVRRVRGCEVPVVVKYGISNR